MTVIVDKLMEHEFPFKGFKLNIYATWISFGLFLAPPKSADHSFTALLISVAGHVEFMTFLAIQYITVHSFFTGLLFRTLSLVIPWGYHLQIDAHSSAV